MLYKYALSKNLSVIKIFLSVLTVNRQCKINPYGITHYYLLPLSMNNFDNTPSSFAVCYLANCPRKNACLRFIAGEKLEKTKIFALCVLPYALQPNGICQMYRDSTPIKGAYGFSTLLSNVRKKDLLPLREKIMAYLGNQTAYYSYRSGKRLLTPEQQEQILAFFREQGYIENLHFDYYCETYDFTD